MAIVCVKGATSKGGEGNGGEEGRGGWGWTEGESYAVIAGLFDPP